MKLSLRYKTALLLIIIVLVGGGFATYTHINYRIQALFEEMQTRAYSMGQVIGLMFAEPLLTGQSVDISLDIQMEVWLEEIPHARFLTVYNSNGQKIFSSLNNNTLKINNFELSGEVFENAMLTPERQVSRKSAQHDILDMLIPIRLFRTDFGLVRLGFDTGHFQQERNEIIYYNSIYGALFLLLTFFIGNHFAGFIIAPIERLETLTQNFGEGKLETRAKITTGDEIERLGSHFNQMAENLQERINDLNTIQELNRKISSTLRPEELHDQIMKILCDTWHLDQAALIFFEKNQNQLEISAGLNISRLLSWSRSEHPGLFNLLDSIDFQKTITEKKSIEFLANHFEIEPENRPEEIVAFKLETDSQKLGYMLLSRKYDRFDSHELNLLTTMTHQIKIALENALHYMKAVTDGLTQLYNRRFLDIQLNNELNDEVAHPLSLLMIDIDNFKNYNDTYGHPAGDEVLQKLAKTFLRQVRTIDTKGTARKLDTVARYGGEEFSIILPQTNLEDAVVVANRVREATAELNFFEEQITISIGAAEAYENESSTSLINRADQALYRAKEKGKNQVCTANK